MYARQKIQVEGLIFKGEIRDGSMLPSELLRRGRFDELFFVDLPTEEERREIISLYMSKYLDLHFEGEFANKMVAVVPY